jgi:hypothetical protein
MMTPKEEHKRMRRDRERFPDCAGLGCPRKVGRGSPPAVLLFRDRATLLCGLCARFVSMAVPESGTAVGQINGERCLLRVYSLDAIHPDLLPRA